MQAAGVDHVDLLILTGALGTRVDWRNAVCIGMLPLAASPEKWKLLKKPLESEQYRHYWTGIIVNGPLK